MLALTVDRLLLLALGRAAKQGQVGEACRGGVMEWGGIAGR